MQKITTFLWFNTNAEEAMKFYVSVFKNSKIVNFSYYGDAGPGPKGSVMVGTFELDGQQFCALNGGPSIKFTEAISLVVNCDTQEEIDYFWNKLSEGGSEVECGWLKDKFGLFWQIVPRALNELIVNTDPEKANRVMKALFTMKKLNIKALKDAYENK
ncbi:MAG TPA: VOC family protein [Puia sp.]|nr:VOC family protein [Puia sp.]